MPTQFQIKRSTVSGVRPTTSNIRPGELGINIQDGILFSANSTAVFEVGANLTSSAVGNSTSRFTANTTQFYANVPVQFLSTFAVGNSSTNTSFVVNSFVVSVGAGFEATGTVHFPTTTQHISIGWQQTSGTTVIGGPSQSGSINVGRSTNNQTLSIANGATTLGNTKTVQIGVGGVNGSITNILIGPNTAGVAGNTVIAGNNLIVTANTYLNGSLYANGARGTSGQILTSNGTGVAWTAVQSTAYTFSVLETFQANIHTGNSTVNTQVSNSVITINNGNTLSVNSTSIAIGNATVNATFNVSNATVNAITINANTGFTLGTPMKAANGYSFLPNGLVMVWGTVSSNTTVGDITFSRAFTTLYNVQVAINATVYDSTYAPMLIAANTTTANVRTGNATASSVYFMAIGV